MKTLRNILKTMGLIGAMTLTTYCQKEDIKLDKYETPVFKGRYEKRIFGNLEHPSGLSSNYSSNKLNTHKSVNDDSSFNIFVQGPLINMNKGYIKNPVSSKTSKNLNNLTISSSQELDIKDVFKDFTGVGYNQVRDSLWRPIGLTLDNLILNDGSVLLSSNSSDKIFKINSSGLETYIQDTNLDRITDMILGRDGKVYVVQSPLINYNDSSKVEFYKKVMSINNKMVNKEFELPSDVNTHSWAEGSDYYIQKWWRNAPFLVKLKIVENSEEGKKRFGTEFYVSDLLEDVIYKIDNKKNVSVLAKGLRYPSSLAVDSMGNIFYTTSPLWFEQGLTDIEFPTELRFLNPETGQSTTLLKFDEKNIEEYVGTGTGMYSKEKDINPETGKLQRYVMPIGFDVSNVLYESEKQLNFLFTNSHQGTLKLVSIDK